MSVKPPRSVRRWQIVFLLGLLGVPLFASAAFAAGVSADAQSTSSFLQASSFFELVADRSRLIQVSLVVVALGCAVMWWTK